MLLYLRRTFTEVVEESEPEPVGVELLEDLPELMSAAQVARFLNISRPRVDQLRKERKLIGIKRGIWLFHKNEVELFKSFYRFNQKKKPPKPKIRKQKKQRKPRTKPVKGLVLWNEPL